MKRVGLFIAAFAAAASAPASNLDLTSQQVKGARRVCIYGPEEQRIIRSIGAGEPCPRRFRPPVASVAYVPSMAIRIGEGRVNGRDVCVYRHAGVNYSALRQGSMRCPLTPNGSMRQIVDQPQDSQPSR